jgi:hypothetical protein
VTSNWWLSEGHKLKKHFMWMHLDAGLMD